MFHNKFTFKLTISVQKAILSVVGKPVPSLCNTSISLWNCFFVFFVFFSHSVMKKRRRLQNINFPMSLFVWFIFLLIMVLTVIAHTGRCQIGFVVLLQQFCCLSILELASWNADVQYLYTLTTNQKCTLGLFYNCVFFCLFFFFCNVYWINQSLIKNIAATSSFLGGWYRGVCDVVRLWRRQTSNSIHYQSS